MIDRLRPRFEALFGFFESYENEDGLLEKLPAWNFIEWSKANDLVMDVNYPSNMLYARAFEVAAELYSNHHWKTKAQHIHKTVLHQSFNGNFFVDNALRSESGELVPSGESTEVCQYYAFFCGTANTKQFPVLWNYLLHETGAQRSESNPLHPANAFIGTLLRMELLSLHGEGKILLKELKDLFLPMVEKTGTLWEHLDVRASCNHGFASYICVLLDRHRHEADHKTLPFKDQVTCVTTAQSL